MRPRGRFLLLLLLFLTAVPLAALSDAPSEDLEPNRRKLESWRKDPANYGRLRKDAGEFLALPAERREQLLKLDHDLHDPKLVQSGRLLEVLKRYADWLDGLPEPERQMLQGAPGPAARLEQIKKIREQEWVRTLPLAVRTELDRLPENDRAARIVQLHREERQRRQDWQVSFNHWEELLSGKPLPARLSDFPQEVQVYVNEYLRPLLTPEDWARLEKAQGQWPLYPCTLVELADRHPLALAGPRGPTRFSELPAEIQKRLLRGKVTPRMGLKKVEGKWPDFAIAVTQVVSRQALPLPHEFWPSRFEDLSISVREFVRDRLQPVLEPSEEEQLQRAEGVWPNYPQTIQDLAARHSLTVPWQTLPGPRSRWNGYRVPS